MSRARAADRAQPGAGGDGRAGQGPGRALAERRATSPTRWRPAGPTWRRCRTAASPAEGTKDFAAAAVAPVPAGDDERRRRSGGAGGRGWSGRWCWSCSRVMAYAFTRPGGGRVPKVVGLPADQGARPAGPRRLREGQGGARAQPRRGGHRAAPGPRRRRDGGRGGQDHAGRLERPGQRARALGAQHLAPAGHPRAAETGPGGDGRHRGLGHGEEGLRHAHLAQRGRGGGPRLARAPVRQRGPGAGRRCPTWWA